MTAPAKPVDLAAIRARLTSAATGNAAEAFAMRLRDVDGPAMADEIEALRSALTSAVSVATTCDGAGLFTETLARLRSMLPPS